MLPTARWHVVSLERQRSVRVRPDGAFDSCPDQLLHTENEQRLETQLNQMIQMIEGAMPRSISSVVYRPTSPSAQKYWVAPDEWYYVPPSLMANSKVALRHRGAATDHLVLPSLPERARTWVPVQAPFTYQPTRREQ